MKIVNKKSMDELIRISKKYWRTGDTDLLPARIELAKELSDQAFGNDYNWCSFSDLVDSAVKFNKSITNETIYMMFALAGITLYQVATA
jgi:hypothetical protein